MTPDPVGITSEQFAQLLSVLKQLADKQYTISGAADWPMLIAIGTILMGAIGVMWADLRAKLTDHRTSAIADLKEFKDANEKDLQELKAMNKNDHDLIWGAMRDCQNECCPRHTRERVRE